MRILEAAALSTQERVAAQNQQRTAQQADERIDISRERLDLDKGRAAVESSLKVDERLTKEVEQDLKTEAGLRKEVNTLLGDFGIIADNYAKIQAAASDPSAAGDLALVFAYMKLLDPPSSVREGEAASAKNAGGVPDRVRATYNNVLRGENFTEEQRKDFVARADKLFEASRLEAQKTATAYEKIAKNAGVNVDNVLAVFNERNQPAEVTNQPDEVIRFDAQGNRL